MRMVLSTQSAHGASTCRASVRVCVCVCVYVYHYIFVQASHAPREQRPQPQVAHTKPPARARQPRLEHPYTQRYSVLRQGRAGSSAGCGRSWLWDQGRHTWPRRTAACAKGIYTSLL